MNQTLGRAKGFMEGFTPGQRSVVIVAVLALLMGAFALSRWVAQPTWAPLYGNLSGTDASAITTQLTTDGVKYKLEDGGATVLVPQSQVYAERISLSGKGLPAQSGSSSTEGWALLDKQGITATDFQQNIAYQRAIEGELSKTLQAMDGVTTAIVHIAVPAKDVFSTETDKTTASVLLSLAPGTTLSNEQISSITHLVAGSVAGLKADDVTVTDQTGKMLSSTSSGAAGAASALSETDQTTAAFEARMSAKVQAVLDSVVGPGHTSVQVNAALNFDSTNTTSKVYAAPSPTAPPLSAATVQEQYSGGTGNTGGTLGQILPTPIATVSGSGAYIRNQSTVNNSVNTTVAQTQVAPGTVKRMTVAVVLDSKTAGSLTPAAAQALVSNAVSLDPTRGDTVQVTSLPFDTTAAAAAAKALATATKSAQTATYLQLAKKVGLILLIVIIALIVMRRRKKADEQAEIEANASDLPGGGTLLAAAGQGNVIGANGEQLALTQEAEVTRDRMRDEVSALVDSQPEDVAQMLQGWLAERKS
jgi:flagellar M-ring protein FliF